MKTYKVRSQLVTANFSGIVEAKSEEEAIEKFQANDCLEEVDEEPTREEINIEVEECD
jgi:hypothetical protein